MSRYLLEEHAHIRIYDPKVHKNTIYTDLTNWVDKERGKFIVFFVI